MLRKPKMEDYKSVYPYIIAKQHYNRILDPDKAENQEHPFKQLIKFTVAKGRKKLYWFFYKIPKDPNHPELQETRVNKIKRMAKRNKLIYYVWEHKVDDIDIVTIYVQTYEKFKVGIIKLYAGPGDYHYS